MEYIQKFLSDSFEGDVDIKALFDELCEVEQIYQDRYLSEFAKKLKISKPDLRKSFISHKKMLQIKKRQDFFQKTFIEKYKNEFDYTDFVLPSSFFCDEAGYLCFANDKQEATLCNFFIVYEKIIAKDKSFFRLIDNDGKKSLATGRDLIKSDRLAMFFADKGYIYDNKKASLITTYISDYIRLNDAIISTKKGIINTGWHGDEYYIPQTKKDVEWLDNFPSSKILSRFKTNGNIQKQKKMLKELAKGKAFIVSLFALSSVIKKKINAMKMNYICHIGGIRGEGKSFLAKTAVSLFGEPDVSTYGQNWNTTLNGLESYLDDMKDVVTWVDEMENATRKEDIINAIYSFSEGAGRTRAYTKDGEVLQRETKTFSGMMITTGEKGVDEIIVSVKGSRNKPLGLTRRVIDLNVRGVWNGIDKEIVGDLMDENFGLFIVEFVEYVKSIKENIDDVFNGYKKNIKKRLDGKENIYYAMLTVLEILKHMNVIDAEDYDRQYNFILQMLNEEVELSLKTKDIKTQFLNVLENFVAENANKFYKDADVEHNEVVDRVGAYGKINEDATNIYITTTIFNELCEKQGFVKKQVIEELYYSGMLIHDSSRKDKRVYIGDIKTYTYAINLNAIGKTFNLNDDEEIEF